MTAADPEAVPTGNTFDKYGSRQPLVRGLMTRFTAAADELLARAAPESLLDVGCGEGVLTARWAPRVPGPVLGLDLDDPELAAHWARRAGDNLRFAVTDGRRLAVDDDAFALVAAVEVLEHVVDPDALLAEMARVSSDWILASVPREPLWRALNLARGAYVGALGNTPGHIQHFSKRDFLARLATVGEVVAVRTPLPWTMALVAVR